jgi:glycosyltransferase involved in cell wall biosynthesis
MADVTVVIPCYNMRQYIATTIESVLNQTEPVRQVLVIDDGSTDGSAAAVAPYVAGSAGRVELIRQSNAGESAARNVGIDLAQGQFVALLDADDLWMPQKIARQIALIEQHPDAVGVHTRVFNFHDRPEDCGLRETERSKDDPSIQDLIDYHWVCPSSLMIRRQILIDQGLRFEESVRHSEDMLFSADLRLHGPLRLVDDLLVAKRIHAGQQSRGAWHTLRSIESRMHWCRARADRLGAGLADQLQQRLAAKLVRDLEDRYWRRQVQDLHAMLRRAAELCPHALDNSFLARRTIWPAWLYHMRDALTR